MRLAVVGGLGDEGKFGSCYACCLVRGVRVLFLQAFQAVFDLSVLQR